MVSLVPPSRQVLLVARLLTPSPQGLIVDIAGSRLARLCSGSAPPTLAAHTRYGNISTIVIIARVVLW